MTEPKNPQLFDIWEKPGVLVPWRMQLVGYVGQFTTKEAAEKYRDAVKDYRAKVGSK